MAIINNPSIVRPDHIGFFRTSDLMKIVGAKYRLEFAYKVIRWIFPHAHALERRSTRFNIYQTFTIYIGYRFINDIDTKFSILELVKFIGEIAELDGFENAKAHKFNLISGGIKIIIDMNELIPEFRDAVETVIKLPISYIECRYRSFVKGGKRHVKCR